MINPIIDKMFDSEDDSSPGLRRQGSKLNTKIDVSLSEIRNCMQNNPDRAAVRDYVQHIRDDKPDLSDFGDYEILAFHFKEKAYKSVSKGLSTTMTGLTMASSILLVGQDSNIPNVLGGLMKLNDDITGGIMTVLPVDMSIEKEQILEEDKKIIAGEKPKDSVTNLLTVFSVPKEIATDFQDVYQNGITPNNISGIIVNTLSKVIKVNPPKTQGFSAGAFD